LEWLISRICEEFHCLPSQAIREWDDDAYGLALDVIELRGYARAKRAWDDATDAQDADATDRLLQDEAVQTVAEMEHRLAKAAWLARQQKG